MEIAIRSRGRRDRPRRGAAATELALLLPVMTFIVLATTDFARVFYYSSILTNCACNGALYACDPATRTLSPYADVTAAAPADASNLSPAPTVDAPTYSATANGTYSTTPVTNGYVRVNVNWTFTTIITYPGIPPTMTLSRSVRMRMISS